MKIKHTFLLPLVLFAFAIPVSAQSDDDGDAKVVAKSGDEEAKEEKKKAPKVVPMKIGSPAPQLDIEHWIQDGGGHFAKVSEFETDKVYVVEFWATWCGPCISSMPHIAKLQEEYADRGVQVISVTREDTETVDKFLERPLRGSENEDEPQTYRDLTSAYCLTADPDGSTSRDYMTAAKQRGIPCAFIVGKDTKIEWIGHPMSMDEPLEQIVTGNWDRDAFAVKFAAEQKADEVMAELSGHMRKGDIAAAVKAIDDYIAETKTESQISRFKMIKFQVLSSKAEFSDKATEAALDLLSQKNQDASQLNALTWNIYLMASTGRFDNEAVSRAALSAAQAGVDGAGQAKPYLMDTVAHLQHHLGDAEGALVTQKAAIALADPSMKARLRAFKKQLEKELAPEEDEPAEEEAVESTEE